MTYEVALEALASDATMWDDTSTTLLTASTSAWDQSLGVSELSWAADVVGLNTTYAFLQGKVAGLLSEGSTETGNIASTLRAIKKNYEDDEQRAEAAYQRAWEPKP